MYDCGNQYAWKTVSFIEQVILARALWRGFFGAASAPLQSTLIIARFFSTSLGPIPLTFCKSSARRNRPCAVRYCTIRFASSSPIPCNRVNSSHSAALILTGPDPAGAEERAGTAEALASAAGEGAAGSEEEAGDGAGRGRRGSGAFSAATAPVVIIGRICSRIDFPIPFTRSRSSTLRNGPFAMRSATIAAAFDGPISGNLSKSAAVAVFISRRSGAVQALSGRGEDWAGEAPGAEAAFAMVIWRALEPDETVSEEEGAAAK